LGQPGRYRQYRNDYFRRIEAIEYSVKHDDGQRVDEFVDADIIVLGVSRVGKTPVCVYLSLEGWKTANYPLVPGNPLPSVFERIPPSHVVGLTLAPAQLLRFRIARQQALGIQGGDYVDLARIIDEMRAANHLFSQHGFHMIDVTDKPIEATSEEIIAAVVGQRT
jgi:regulator of PEP synthase PpsR (kinase-PPPase family)